jgi:hypothetical protein
MGQQQFLHQMTASINKFSLLLISSQMELSFTATIPKHLNTDKASKDLLATVVVSGMKKEAFLNTMATMNGSKHLKNLVEVV